MPATRDYIEEIPGKHGAHDFGCELEPRILELHCAIDVDPSEKPALIRRIANYLNPLRGMQTLTFADEPDKIYHVRYSGKIDITHFADGLEFTIPFRALDPFAVSVTQRKLTGGGVANNRGTAPSPFIIVVRGLTASPTVTVNGNTMSYVGTIQSGSTLIIDTEHMTVTLDGINALANYNGIFPTLLPGENNVSAPSTATLTWYDRWV